jgi:hypothetical protein
MGAPIAVPVMASIGSRATSARVHWNDSAMGFRKMPAVLKNIGPNPTARPRAAPITIHLRPPVIVSVVVSPIGLPQVCMLMTFPL